MGPSNCSLTFLGLDASNWIDIIAIIVNIGLGLWIAISLQNSANNKRVLKDHFIGEIKDIRDNYNDFFNKIETMRPSEFLPWFKLMNIKLGNISYFIIDRYKINPDTFNPYLIELNNLISNNQDFIAQFSSSSPIVFSNASKIMISKFQQKYYSLFNSVIVTINDH